MTRPANPMFSQQAAIADDVEPRYRSGKRSYSCCGAVAHRWSAAWQGADAGMTSERALILAHITGKIRACEAAAAEASGPDATGYEVTITRLTVLHEEIAAGLHVPDHQEEPKA